MKGTWSNFLFLLVIVLGAVGLVSLLWLHPMLLVKRLIIGGLILGGIYVIYRIMTGKTSSNDANNYRRAVRQSRRRRKLVSRYRKRATSKLQPIPTNKSLKKKRPPLSHLKQKGHGHLTVIEGKKKKRKRGFL